MEKLDFIESEAKANAAFHVACCESLAREANTFLTLILTGAGATFWYALNLSAEESYDWQLYGISAVSLYLFIVAALTTGKCLWAREIYPPSNEPTNLNQANHDLDVIRLAELKNRQRCIDFNRERNDEVGLWLNRCRLMASAAPFIFLISALASYL